MRTLLLLLLLFAFFLEPAFASCTIPDSALPTVPMSFYPDPEGILEYCGLCEVALYACHCRKYHPPSLDINITSSMILEHEEWESSRDPNLYFPTPDTSVAAPFPEQQPAPGEAHAYYYRQPLEPHNLQQLNENATTVMSSTIQAHLRDIYHPLDRLELLSAGGPGLIASGGPPHHQPKRQPLRPGGGYPCDVEGCGRAFDRNCDLTRHQKTHTDDSKRPHKCSVCDRGFLYPKDVVRHQKTHDDSLFPQSQLRCPVPGCSTNGFSRQDNLLRHQRKKHPYLLA